MSFVSKIFSGGESKGDGALTGRMGTTPPVYGTMSSPKPVSNQLLNQPRGKTKTTYTGPLGLASKADTIRKTLLGQ